MIYKLSDICHIEKGKTGIKKAISGQYPLVVTADQRLSSNEYQFDCEAVCIPLVSSSGHGEASLKRIHYQKGKFALGNILCAVIPKDKELVLAEYLYIYLLIHKDKILVPLMKGAANVSMTIGSLANINIPVPEMKIQKEIIEKYNKIISKIYNISRINEDNIFQLNELINLKICYLFYSNDCERINEILKKNQFEDLQRKEIYQETKYRYLRLADICKLENGIKNQGKKKKYLDVKYLRTNTNATCREGGYLIEKDDYMILVDGENSGEIFKSPETGIMGSTFKKLIINDEIHDDYVLEFLKFHKNTFKNSKTGAAIPHLNKKLFSDLIIPIPSYNEQETIANEIKYINLKKEMFNELQNNNEVLLEQLKCVFVDNLLQ